jgi:hypothetical protein
MMPYGVYCDTLHRLRSVQSLQLPLFLKVVLGLQHFGHFVKGFFQLLPGKTGISQHYHNCSWWWHAPSMVFQQAVLPSMVM